jgi:cellulose synthase/poly-beta-1,6-N-acetylglucosamine synthase-like glycosyltransferase
LVRIRNRSHLLSRFQDYEFLVFSSLTQTAREKLGSVGLGGNGQFTRLSALIGLGATPWSDCLTEDLDLGVRLAIAGWDNRFCGETYVDQQGLTSLPRLLRQRTRWAHGHFQCWKLIPKVIASSLPTVTVLDLCYYLMAPAFVLASSLLFTVPLLLLLLRIAAAPLAWDSRSGLIYLAAVYLFSFGPALALAMLYRRRAGDVSVASAVLLGHLLAAYNYIWYLAEWKALVRILVRRRGWTKTNRIQEHAVGAVAAGAVSRPRRARHATGGPGSISIDELTAGPGAVTSTVGEA